MNSISKSSEPPVLVLGGGSWGATLADLLARQNHTVRLWEFDPKAVLQLRQQRCLPGKLEDFTLAPGVQVDTDLEALADGVTTFVMVVPSRFMRATAQRLRATLPANADPLVVSCSKGLDPDNQERMSQVLQAELAIPYPVVLSGPSHAEEVSRQLPTTVVAASQSPELAAQVQDLFMTNRFRVYTADDVVGVELGAALKNVVAIAAGAAAGMGFGDNTMAALVTRGLAELSRLGVAMGARPLTFAGLSGMGDLVVTCASRHSRNRRLGMALARGLSLDEALQEIGMVVEGVETARSIQALQNRWKVEMPIARQVARVLFEGLPVDEAVNALMLRDPKPEPEFE